MILESCLQEKDFRLPSVCCYETLQCVCVCVERLWSRTIFVSAFQSRLFIRSSLFVLDRENDSVWVFLTYRDWVHCSNMRTVDLAFFDVAVQICLFGWATVLLVFLVLQCGFSVSVGNESYPVGTNNARIHIGMTKDSVTPLKGKI